MTDKPAPGEGSTSAFLHHLCVNIVVAILCLLWFSSQRTKNTPIYRPRQKIQPRSPLYAPETGFLSWLPHVWHISEDDVMKGVGCDQAAYLYFARMASKVFSSAAAIAVILIILNATGGGSTTGMLVLTVANVQKDSFVLYVHAFAAWAFAIGTMAMTRIYFAQTVLLRRNFLETHKDWSRWTLVDAIPSASEGDHNVNLGDFFRRNFPESFTGALECRDLNELEKADDERKEILYKLENATAKHQLNGERPSHRTGFLGLCGEKVDSIQFYSEKLNESNHRVSELLARSSSAPLRCAGFVQFDSSRNAQLASQALMYRQVDRWNVTEGPDPSSIVWKNVGMPLTKRKKLSVFVTCCVFAIVLLWTFPIGIVVSMTSPEALARDLPFLAGALESSALKPILEGLIPTLIVLVFLSLVPKILRYLSLFEGIDRLLYVDRAVLARYYGFLLVNVLFVSVASSQGIFQSIEFMFVDPPTFFLWLGEALPKSANFFQMFVILGLFGEFPVEISRITPTVINWAKKKWICKTVREVEEVDAPPVVNVSVLYAKHTLIFTIGLTFSTIAPLIVPFAAAFFLSANVTYRYQFVHVYKTEYEGSALLWENLLPCITLGSILSNVFLASVMLFKEAYGPFTLLVPLVVLIVYLGKQQTAQYVRPLKYLPMTMLTEMEEDTLRDPKLVEKLYTHPSLSTPATVACRHVEVWRGTQGAPVGFVKKSYEPTNGEYYEDTEAQESDSLVSHQTTVVSRVRPPTNKTQNE